jgi:hypothetical protein
MDTIPLAQAAKLADLIRAARAGSAQAERGMLFSSGPGIALVNAAFELFECDGLYDLTLDVAREAGVAWNRAETNGKPVMNYVSCPDPDFRSEFYSALIVSCLTKPRVASDEASLFGLNR